MKNKILVVIPARGGSKGVPRKNIKLLKNKPLINYTTESARKIFSDKIICVSSDDQEIIDIVEKSGLSVPFKRPKNISTDNSSSYDVILHALDFYSKKNYNPDVLILLQPTSPFRTAEHISEALKLYISRNVDMVVAVKKAKSSPYFNLFEENSLGLLKKSKKHNFIRRQDAPNVWEVNGAIYIIKVKSLRTQKRIPYNNVIKFEMSDQDSHDIDTYFDWSIAESLVKKNN